MLSAYLDDTILIKKKKERKKRSVITQHICEKDLLSAHEQAKMQWGKYCF